MRLTLNEFRKEYQTYKDDYDLELMLRVSRTTYAQAKIKQERAQEWF